MAKVEITFYGALKKLTKNKNIEERKENDKGKNHKCFYLYIDCFLPA